MVILRTRNKITDFWMILAWASPFNIKLAGNHIGPIYAHGSSSTSVKLYTEDHKKIKEFMSELTKIYSFFYPQRFFIIHVGLNVNLYCYFYICMRTISKI